MRLVVSGGGRWGGATETLQGRVAERLPLPMHGVTGSSHLQSNVTEDQTQGMMASKTLDSRWGRNV